MDAWAHHTGVITTDLCAGWLASIERSSSMLLFSIPGIDLEGFARALAGTELPGLFEQALGGPVVCDVDQCWVRRQYAPFHAPHSWHQDGALHFDFLACSGPPPAEAVLDMITCWIPLTPCGSDAPGLELIARRNERLLMPAELTDPRIRERFAPTEFQTPAMQPGDAVLFRGDILHRTHVTPQMTKDRTSIELRLFPANRIPERLSRDRFESFST